MDGNDQDENEESELRPAPRVFTGQRARSVLGALVAPAARPRLVVDCQSMARVDAYAGAVLGCGIHAHLVRDARNEVVIVEPVSDACWAILHDLLGESLPPRCRWAGSRPMPTRGREVVLPATLIADDEDVTLITDVALRPAVSALGFGDRAGRLLQEAAAGFLDNARTHGARAPIHPVICAALDRQVNDLQLVVCDLGPDVPADGQAALHAAVVGSRGMAGSIQSLVGLTRDQLDFSVRLAHGVGRAHYRKSRSWHFSTGSDVPGFIAGIEVHR